MSCLLVCRCVFKSISFESHSNHVAILSLEESHKSIQQAQSTKRLTQLAYVFLPLSLSASIFGMNVTELQSVSIAAPIATASIILALSLVFWFLLSQMTREEVVDIGRTVVILWRLFWRAPGHTSLLLLFGTCHSTAKTRLLLRSLGLWTILWSKVPSSKSDSESDSEMELPLTQVLHRQSTWSAF